MVISPNDFSLWARLTGNKYPSTPAERAQKGPEVQRFIQNLDKEGMLGGKQEEEQKKKKGLPEKIATGALIAGGIAAGVAAARDPRVQNVAQRAGSATKDKIKDFLVNFSEPRDVDVDIVDASGDVTPNPREQQANVAPQLTGTSAAGRLTSLGDDQLRDRDFGVVTFDRNISDMSPEQINQVLTEARLDRKLDKKVTQGTLTRGDERRFLKREFRKMDLPADPDTLNQRLDSFVEDSGKPFFGDPAAYNRDRTAPGGYVRKTPFEEKQFAKGVRGTVTDVGSRYNPRNIFTGEPVAVDRFTPLSEGKTSFTEGAVSKENPYDDISNLEQRVDRTYGKFLSNLKPEDAAKTRESLIRGAAKERDYALGYMNAMARGRTDEQAAITGRKFAGYDLSPAVKPQTPFREALSNLKIASTVPAKIDDLLKLVETGPQIILPEKAQKINDGSSAIVLAGGGNNTNVIPTMGATIGGSSLTDKHATKMAVDNALDNVRAELTGTPVPITGVTSTGLKTFVQDDNLRRIAPTPEQAQAIREEPGRVSRTFDEMTGFTAPKSETISTNPLEERISRLEGKTAELRAIQENLGRAGELMSAGLDPRTTRFDSARAAGLTSKSGIKPRITNPRFQENMNLGKVQEAAIPESSGRVFFEQDSEGRVIPETVERRSERKVVRGPDTKTRSVAGGYVGMEGQSGSVIGPYGIEASDSPKADITKRPTDTGGKQSFSNRPPSANPVESFDVANELRKIQTDQNISPEERRSRSKDFLKQKMSERGISAIGESEPLRKR